MAARFSFGFLLHVRQCPVPEKSGITLFVSSSGEVSVDIRGIILINIFMKLRRLLVRS